jgi:hypothetical protein
VRHVICKEHPENGAQVVIIIDANLGASVGETLPEYSFAADPDGLAALRDFVRTESGRVTHAWTES